MDCLLQKLVLIFAFWFFQNGIWNIDNILSDLNTSESPIAHQYRSQPGTFVHVHVDISLGVIHTCREIEWWQLHVCYTGQLEWLYSHPKVLDIQAGLHLGGLTLLSQLWSGSTCSTRRCFAEITIDLKLALISLLLHTHGCTHTLSLPIVQQLLINKSTLGPELHPQMLDMQYTCIINLQKSRQRIWFGDQQPRHQIIVCQYWNTTLTLLLHVKHKGQEGQFTKQVMTTNTP